MANANINSFTVNTSIVGTTKFYTAVSPYGSTDDSATTFTTINSYLNHDNLSNYDVNKHREMATSNSTIVVWSGYHINSLLGTKLNSVNLSTYATSANLDTTTGLTHTNSTNLNNHINSIQVHTNHNSVFIQGAEGITGGGNLTSTRTLTLDIGNLTEVSSVAKAVGRVAVYDTVLASHRYISANSLAPAASGEANTASSAGSGTSVFYQKNGVDLEFNAIKSENSILGVALDGVTNDIELTVDETAINHDNLSNYDVNKHREMATSNSTIVVWSGYHINSLLGTKLNSVNLSTYATSANLNTTTGLTHTNSTNLDTHTSITSIHRGMDTSNSTIVVWSGYHINSLLGTKLNSVNLSTYATSTSLNTHTSNTSIHANHADISIGTNTGLSGGGNITSTRTISLDWNALTAITTVDPGADVIALYSDTNTAHRKVKPYEFWGILETTQISTTTYSVQSTDFGKHLEFTGTAVQTVTIGNDADLSFPVDGSLMFTCINTNGLTFTGGTSSTVNNVQGFTTVTSLYAVGGWRKRAAQTWVGWGAFDS